MADKQLRFWSLRWSCPTKDTIYAEGLREFLKTLFDKFVFQLENTEREVEGKIKDNPHYQIFAHSASSTRKFTLVRQINGAGYQGLDVRPSSTEGISSLQNYCMKRDKTYVAGPWNEDGLMDIEVPYDGSDLKYIADSPYPWQKYFMDKFLTQPDPRKIYWVCDLKGNSGKSEFVKYCAFKYGANFMGWCKYADAANLVQGAAKKKIFIFDLVRTKPRDISHGDLYSAIESIKGGLINNTKYVTQSLFFHKPHVVVFSNELPQFDKLSLDRWVILFMDSDRSFSLGEHTAEEAQLVVPPIDRKRKLDSKSYAVPLYKKARTP